jgi:hypothetical protein
MSIDVRTATPMLTRPCRVCVALQGDSAFADFDLDPDGHLFLVRISFDGYGCCHIKGPIGLMDHEDSRNFIDAYERGDVNRADIHEILYSYFRDNRHAMWKDALEKHGILND